MDNDIELVPGDVGEEFCFECGQIHDTIVDICSNCGVNYVRVVKGCKKINTICLDCRQFGDKLR